MAGSKFTPATRKRTKLRLALDGPAGAGKTYTLLRFAFALAAANVNGSGRTPHVAVIDSEAGSASKYQGDSPDGVPWLFDVLELDTHAPTDYTAAIEEAGRLGYDALVVDSLSHAWQGKDGALELVNKKGGNSYTAWKDVTPMHTRMIDAILRAPLHVLVSMRSKVDYVLETNDKGQQVPRKIGMAPIQRAGMEYEFDIYGSLDWSHILTISKSRCSTIDGATVVKPGPAFLEPVIRWLDTGEVVAARPAPRVMADDAQIQIIVNLIGELGMTVDAAKKEVFRRYTSPELGDMTIDQAGDFESRLKQRLATKRKEPSPVATPPVTPPNPPAPDAAVSAAPTVITSAGHVEGSLQDILQKRVDGEPEPESVPQPAKPDIPVGDNLKIHDPTKIRLLWDWFVYLTGMDDETSKANWKEVLSKRNCTDVKSMGIKDRSLLGTNLLERVRKIHSERGDPAACPFGMA